MNARTPSANAMLHLLEAPGDRVIIGSFGANEAAEVQTCSGVWPGLLGSEYCRGWGIHELDDLADAIDWRGQNPALITQAQAGGIIRVLTHLPNPCRARLGGLRDQDADLAAILLPGTEERARWLLVIAQLAAGFHDLAAHGASVLFGPLHEMNCRGFWWGAAGLRNPKLYRALWRDLHEQLTVQHGCSNLLWLFAPLANDHDPLHLAMYPGDDVVDVVGLDLYAASLIPYTPQYHEMMVLRKPFILSEFGPMAWDVPADAPSTYDCLTLLNEIFSHWPATRACMFWSSHFGAARHAHCHELLGDARALGRMAVQEALGCSAVVDQPRTPPQWFPSDRICGLVSGV